MRPKTVSQPVGNGYILPLKGSYSEISTTTIADMEAEKRAVRVIYSRPERHSCLQNCSFRSANMVEP